MGGSSFDLIAQEIQKQYHIMEEMKAENRKLHQQLTDLRAGQGIFLEISGTRLALEVPIAPTASLPPAQPTASTPTETSRPPQNAKKSGEEQVPTADQANSKITTSLRKQAMAPDTANVSPQGVETKGVETTRRPSTFLEEIMLDEFESALTAPIAIEQGQEQKSEISEEKKKAALRHELIGSFLLE